MGGANRWRINNLDQDLIAAIRRAIKRSAIRNCFTRRRPPAASAAPMEQELETFVTFSMTQEQVKLVQQSFAKVAPIAEQAAGLFYDRLFEIDPKLRALFKTDIAEQGKKLMAALTTVVTQLDDMSRIAETVRGLGRAHARFGVVPEHYVKVGAALLWTLEKGLGAAFTPEVRAAWLAAYSLVAETMIEAAESTSKAA
jgi:nitric oxide dioxygenase